jgi:hypothetical protein
MGLDEDSRIHTIGDAHVVRNFAAPIEVPIRYRIDDVSGASPDFADLSAKGRVGSRDRLVDALSKRIQRVVGASDHQDAYDMMSDFDGGLFRRDGVRSALEQAERAELASDPARRDFAGWVAPERRLVGSTSTPSVRAALLEWPTSATIRQRRDRQCFGFPRGFLIGVEAFPSALSHLRCRARILATTVRYCFRGWMGLRL